MSPLLLSLLPPFCIAAGIAVYAYRKFDKPTLILLLAALAFYYFHFSSSSWEQFAVDVEAHRDYVAFILDHGRLPLPSDKAGAAARHPPAFYLVAAAFMKLGRDSGLDAVQFTRHASMLFYAIFILIGTHILRMVPGPGGLPYYSALLLLFFWPVGVTMGGRITCDTMLYAAQAGCLYALLRWWNAPSPQRIAAPFVWGAFAVLAKNSGTIMLGFAWLALLHTAWLSRNALRSLLRCDLVLSIAFALLASHQTSEHGWIMKHSEVFSGYHWDYFWRMLGTFNIFVLVYDTDMGLALDSFWNIWIHSLLLGGPSMGWKSYGIMLVAKVLFLALSTYILHGLLRYRRSLSGSEMHLILLFAAFTCVTTAAAGYFLLLSANFNYADARYAFPAVILIASSLGLVMQHHRTNGNEGMARAGGLLSLGMTATTIALFGAQYLG